MTQQKFYFLVIFLGIILGILLLSPLKNITPQPITINTNAPQTQPSASSAGAASEAEVRAPDQKKSLISQKKITDTGENNYRVVVTDVASSEEKELLTKNYDTPCCEIKLPMNAWSPDSNYLFFEEKQTTESSYYVFKATGENFPDGSTYLDPKSLFIERQIPFIFDKPTGWASETLIIFMTKKPEDGSKGPSYWFEVPSKAFIQLATR